MSTPMAFPVDPAAAGAFADRWVSAWNAHDLNAIMACYAPSIEHSSPFIKRYNGSDDRSIRGIDAVRGYFARGLDRNPDLRFDLMHVTAGIESVALVYRRMAGEIACEIFLLDKSGLIVRSISHYG